MKVEKKGIQKVSVVVPNYNYKRFLRKRVNSILRQTYPIYELIILDDASTDGSQGKIEEIVQEVKKRCPKLAIKTVMNNQNSGKAIKQWIKGFEAASGDYIWIAEVDDLARKTFLAEAMKGFDDPEVVLSYTESAVINGWGIMIVPDFRWSRDKEKTGHYDKNYIKDGKDEIREIMAIRCTIPNVSAVVFKNNKRWLKYLEKAAEFKQTGDWYFYTKVLENGKICYNRKSLNYFRVHNDSVTKGSKKSGEHYQEVLKMHQMFLGEYDLDEAVKDRMKEEVERIKAKHKVMAK